MKKRVLSTVLAIMLVVSLLAGAVCAAALYSDTEGHWGEAAINRWTEAGIVGGYGDGTFHPDDLLTRAEAAVIFSNLLKMTKKADTSKFTDMNPAYWYVDPIAKCVSYGILQGTSATTMEPYSYLTRAQMIVMTCRALGIEDQATVEKAYEDIGKVPSWAEGSVNAMSNRGYLDSNGNQLKVEDYILRAAVMQLLANSIGAYADKPNSTVAAAEKGVTLVVADGVTVTGKGEQLTVAVPEPTDPNAKQPVVTASGLTTDDVVVTTGTEVRLTNGTKAGKAHLLTTANGSTVTTEAGSTVQDVVMDADNATVQGTGTVGKAEVNGKNDTVNTKNTTVTTSPSATGTKVNDTPVDPNKTVNSDNPTGETTTGGSTGPSTQTKKYHLTVTLTADDDATLTVTGTKDTTLKQNAVLQDIFDALADGAAANTNIHTTFAGRGESAYFAQILQAYADATAETPDTTNWDAFVNASTADDATKEALTIGASYETVGEGTWTVGYTSATNFAYTATITIAYN
ncbi:MAG: S-layer homology domain-containing protein [Oscillospiraceae bacterium]|nr:S-layer homology domain-containing protein [Oscillospiraceae bacterium]